MQLLADYRRYVLRCRPYVGKR